MLPHENLDPHRDSGVGVVEKTNQCIQSERLMLCLRQGMTLQKGDDILVIMRTRQLEGHIETIDDCIAFS